MWTLIDWNAYYPRAGGNPAIDAPEVRIGAAMWLLLAGAAFVLGAGGCAAMAAVTPGPTVEELAARADSDGDGTPDRKDLCPLRVGPIDHAGCPITDSDGDGVPDELDLCPLVRGQAGSPSGCPPVVLRLDTDGDGVPDEADACPLRPELRNGYHDDDGCPDRLPPAIADFTHPLDDVRLERGGVRLTPAGRLALKRAARVLLNLPDAGVVLVGHADGEGTTRELLHRSVARARSVRAALMALGVPAERIVIVGVGDMPERDRRLAPSMRRGVELRLAERVVETAPEPIVAGVSVR